MVRLVEAVAEPRVAVIVVTPIATALAKPFEFPTVATVESEEDHET
jgi:hypothetical protein